MIGDFTDRHPSRPSAAPTLPNPIRKHVKTPALAALIGLVAGLTGGLFGVGGGLVAVPALVLLFRLAQHRAHATSVTAIVATATAALIPFALDGEVEWMTAGLLVAGAAGGAVAGAALMGRVDEVTLARAFVAITVVAGFRLLMLSDASAVEIFSVETPTGAVFLVLTGLVAGTLAALLGVGGGLVFVPAMVVLFGFEQHLAQGTSLAAIVPTTLIASVRHARLGRVDWHLVFPIAVGGIVGGIAGALLALELAPASLRAAFVGLLVVVSVRMVRRTRRRHA
jgi:uncharacterized membrane protein YfcA